MLRPEYPIYFFLTTVILQNGYLILYIIYTYFTFRSPATTHRFDIHRCGKAEGRFHCRLSLKRLKLFNVLFRLKEKTMMYNTKGGT